MDRRGFCFSVSALATLFQFAEQTAAAQTSSAVLSQGTATLADNHVFRAGELPIKPSSIGSSQAVVHGALPTGESIEMHNTVLDAGHEPHPPHQHPHAEFLFLKEGNVDWLIDGKRQPAAAGDILYAAPGVLHGLRNVGTTPAKYFVLAIGANLKTA